MRKYREIADGKLAIVDILCDACGDSCRTLEGFEVANLDAAFEEGIHTGDRFAVELCQVCFDSILAHIIVDRMGTCAYHNVNDGVSMNMEELREFYAHLRAGTVLSEVSEDEEELQDYDEDGDEDFNQF